MSENATIQFDGERKAIVTYTATIASTTAEDYTFAKTAFANSTLMVKQLQGWILTVFGLMFQLLLQLKL